MMLLKDIVTIVCNINIKHKLNDCLKQYKHEYTSSISYELVTITSFIYNKKWLFGFNKRRCINNIWCPQNICNILRGYTWNLIPKNY